MNLQLLAKELEDKGFGILDTDIFVSSMPSIVKSGILIKLPLARPPKFDPYIPGRYKSNLQILVRAPNYLEGKELSDRIFKEYTDYGRREYKNQFGKVEFVIDQIFPEALPINYPRSDGGEIEWSINFELFFHIST